MSRMRIVLLVLLVTNGARGWTSSRFRPCRSLSRDAVGSQLRRSRKEERSGAKYWHSNTVLPSSYSEARCPPLCVWLMPSPRRFFKTMKERRGIVRTVKLIVSIVLSLVVIFGPMCSTAQAMVTGSLDATASSLAIKSRALGSFNLYPSRKDLELSFRLIYATCCGALIGLERSAAERPAGVRTMALVGLGASAFAIASTHGFVPQTALGLPPGSPLLDGVKADLSRVAAGVVSGVGFIGAGAVHKSNIGDGSEGQSLVAGLTTAAAIWCSAAVGVASAVGLYCVSTTATFATICVLKYARVPKQEEEPRFPKPRPLDIINDEDRRPLSATARTRASVDGLFGRDYSNSRTIEPYPTSKKSLPQPQEIPSVLLDPRLEHVLSRLLQDEPPIRIEEEQVVVKNTRDNIKKDMEP
mmetsp:Transcript_12263/g.27965  ORF Transcript_12263/g.27965 Transcript_12263/m.27965 type:complete len:413 (+) Transcript_12263:278-1516(+)